MAENFNPFYKLLKTEGPINITSESVELFGSVNKALKDACELSLKEPFPNDGCHVQKRWICPLIEDNPEQKIQSMRKTDAPVAFGSKIFSPAQLKSIYILKRVFVT